MSKPKKAKVITCNEDLYKEIAAERGINPAVVKDIFLKGQSKYTMFMMQNNFFENIRWKYLGTFLVKAKLIPLVKTIKGLTQTQKEFYLRQLTPGMRKAYFDAVRVGNKFKKKK